VEGFDFTKASTLVAIITSVRYFLAVATARGWELYQIDVNNIFLHRNMEEEVHMTLCLVL